MLAVKFYEDVKDELLRFAVVIAKHDGKWVLCKHKERETLEFPGGHRETGEAIAETAKRELMEETGAVKFEIRPICVYSVTGKSARERDGRGSVRRAVLCGNRIVWGDTQRDGENCIMRRSPENQTYPEIQPTLLKEAERRGFGV